MITRTDPTDLEMLPEFGLINMNGRMYDPMLGRFLSPDNYVQMPDFSQNFNRYSYCLNNPLKYVDPDGEFFIFTVLSAIGNTIGNIIKHGFNTSEYSWKKTKNAAKIDWGMFQGNVMQIIEKWTYGFYNSYIGNIVAHTSNWLGFVDDVTHFDGALALSGVTNNGKAFTIGPYIFGPDNFRADWHDHLFVHEYGHYIQSQYLGSLYVPIVGLPSLMSGLKIGGNHHKFRWFEVSANKLSASFFDKKYGSGASGYTKGNPNYFDIYSFTHSGVSSPYVNPRNNRFNDTSFYPTNGTRHSWADYIVLFYSTILI